MFIHTYDLLIEVCKDLKLKEILNLVICDKYLNLIHKDFILWKLILYRDFPLYEVIDKKPEFDYYTLYKKCLYSKCDAFTSCYPDEDRPINNIGIAWGPRCGGLWNSIYDKESLSDFGDSLFLLKPLSWFSINANTKILIPGNYNIYWRLKVYNNCILSRKDFLFLDNSIIKLKEWTTNDQEQIQNEKWNQVYAGNVYIENSGKVTAMLENKQSYCKGYGIDTVFFLPEELRIK